jgi:hypothetical protein
MLTEPLTLFDLLGAALFGACITALIYAKSNWRCVFGRHEWTHRWDTSAPTFLDIRWCKHCPVTEQWQESDDGTSAHWVRIDT